MTTNTETPSKHRYSEYKNGSIVSMCLVNFQTFTSQRFVFGPSLNLIAAPNGSGKSSIANAIALVFNGTPKTIGKTKDITEYIKFGCTEAVITVEVLYDGEINVLSRRITSTQNQYFLHDRLVLQKDYMALVEKMGINVNNLCMFLPQERVSEFCRMTPKELLEETLKNTQIDVSSIKGLYDRIGVLEEVLKTNDKKREMVQTGLDKLQQGLEEEEKRMKMVGRLAALRYRKNEIDHENMKDRYSILKQEGEETAKKLAEYDETLARLVQNLAEKKNDPVFVEYTKGVEILMAQNEQIRQAEARLRRGIERVEILKVDNENAKGKIKQKQKDIAEKKDCIRKVVAECEEAKRGFVSAVEQFRKKVVSMSADPEFSGLLACDGAVETAIINTVEDLERFVPSLRQIDDEIRDFNHKLSQIQSVSQDIQKKIEDLERQRQIHTSKDTRRLEMLRKYHFDTYRGVIWLRENHKLFQDEVLEPLYHHLTVDGKYSRYVEPFLSFQALSSFIAKNDHDFALLTNILKDTQNLSINVAMHIPCTTAGISRKDLEKFGLVGVLSDFIECRQEYLDFLNTYGHFNAIPISTKEINEEEVFNGIPECKRMAIENRYSEIKRSRYGNDYVIITNRLVQRGIFNFPTVNIDQINREMAELNAERERNKRVFGDILKAKDTLIAKKNHLKKELDFSDASRLAYGLKRQLMCLEFNQNELAKLEALDYSADFKRIESEMQAAEKAIEREHVAFCDILDLDNVPMFNVDLVKSMRLDVDNDSRQIVYVTHLKSVEEDRIRQMAGRKCEIKALLKELQEKLVKGPEMDMTGLPDTAEAVEDEMSVLEAKLSMVRVQDGIKTSYMEKSRLLASITNDATDIGVEKASLEKHYEREVKRLVNEINTMLVPVGENFAKLFSRFGFAGKLEIDTAGRDWELKILVKFREQEELQQLSSYRQSGGEKSLATALFLLSLQQHESVPFRLVDEINQGMDAANERRVFEVLKEMGDCSQFFIITPKMVDGLEFSDTTTAIILYGGPGVTKDIEKYLQDVIC